MKNKQRFCSLFFVIILSILFLEQNKLIAQPQVIISVRRPPPNQLKISDLWEITINNLSRQNRQVYLNGKVTEAKDGEVLNVNTNNFTITPGVKIYRANDVEPIRLISAMEKYKVPFLRTGGVPDGDYEVCVKVLEVETLNELGSDCFIQNIKNLSPPILLSPNDGAEVDVKLPIFTWLAPSPIARGLQVNYTFKLVTMFRGQTPFDAMTSNPAVIIQPNISQNIFQFPISTKQLTPNTNYAWKIIAYNGRTLIGESEIWSFNYKPLALTDKVKDVVDGKKNEIPKIKNGIVTIDNGRKRKPYNDPIIRTPADKTFIPIGDKKNDEDDLITPIYLIEISDSDQIPDALEFQLLKKCYK